MFCFFPPVLSKSGGLQASRYLGYRATRWAPTSKSIKHGFLKFMDSTSHHTLFFCCFCFCFALRKDSLTDISFPAAFVFYPGLEAILQNVISLFCKVQVFRLPSIYTCTSFLRISGQTGSQIDSPCDFQSCHMEQNLMQESFAYIPASQLQIVTDNGIAIAFKY